MENLGEGMGSVNAYLLMEKSRNILCNQRCFSWHHHTDDALWHPGAVGNAPPL